MGAFAEARRAFIAIKDDPAIVAQIRSEHKSLVVASLTTDDFGFDLTSATVNGQTYGGSRITTKRERLILLGCLIAMLDADALISSRTTHYFGDVKEIEQ